MKYSLPYVTFEATRECNISCLYCYNHWRRANTEIKKNQFKETKNTLDRLFRKIDFQHITFTGGEPLLADGLNELVLACRMKGKGVNIISNGTAASQWDYEILSDLGVSLFEFPLLADNSEVHDALTRQSGSFEKVIQSIRILQSKKSDICVVFVLTKLNLDYLERTLFLAKNLGIKRFMLARFNIGGRGIEHTEKLLVSMQELHSAFDIAHDFAKTQGIKISANVCIPDCILNPGAYPLIHISSCGLEVAKRPVTIDFTGDVRICNHSPHVIGNIHSESLESIFQSEYLKNWQTTCPDYCKECADWQKCGGGCRAAGEQLGNSVEYADPIIELLNGKK